MAEKPEHWFVTLVKVCVGIGVVLVSVAGFYADGSHNVLGTLFAGTIAGGLLGTAVACVLALLGMICYALFGGVNRIGHGLFGASVTKKLVLLSLVIIAVTGLVGWLIVENRSKSDQPMFALDSFSTPVLAGVGLALAWATVMRFVMNDSKSRWIMFYKAWHFPAILAGNCYKQPFIVLVIGLLGACCLVVLLPVLGFIVGGAGGQTGRLIGGGIGLFLGVILAEKLVTRLSDDEFRCALQHDLLSSSGRLQTMDQSIVFPFLCVVQSAIVFGIIGSFIGRWAAGGTVDPRLLAFICAFVGILIAQLLAQAKRGAATSARIPLGIIQGVLLGLLLLPAKRLLGDGAAMSWINDAVRTVFGNGMSVESVLVATAGILTAAFGLAAPVATNRDL